MTIEHVRKQDELHDCLTDSIVLADPLSDSNGDLVGGTVTRAGFILLTKLERARELNNDLWKELRAST